MPSSSHYQRKNFSDGSELPNRHAYSAFVSSASAWEIATKYRIGKLSKAKTLVENYTQTLNQARFLELPITAAHALLAGNLPIEHRDPFDRMLMAQAEIEELPIVTYDSAFQTGRIQVIPSTD